MTLETAVVGGVASESHFSGLQACPATELVAVCDEDESRARERATEYDINAYADFEGLLARESLDWIHLCTPVGTRLELARMAIEDGIPVLIASPVTESVAEAEELERLVAEYDAHVSVAHNRNFSPAMRDARRRIEDGTVGEVRSVDLLSAGGTYPDDGPRGDGAFEFEAGLSHPIYTVLTLGGYPSSPDSVQSSASLANEYTWEFDYGSVQFQYTTDDGVLCSGTVLASGVPHEVVRVHGDRGSIEIDLVAQSVTVLDRDYQGSPGLRVLADVNHILGRLQRTVENLVTVARRALDDDRDAPRTLDSHSYQFGEEARAIQRGEPPTVPVAEGTWTLRVIETLRAGAMTGEERPVPLNTDGM
ncbi:Gfo/Idh/MocA family protein [Haloarcula sediminis]|uniref:Gfo/Idh/MocA family protein n=1 Tax=Haloarcula sediminis TaxID=3111777 RepID=UPI002D775F83|nr:Gfo/Idh/MocA family oxidoreductase [Haloarcula sp. CK38]